jgi:hypothetical protein
VFVPFTREIPAVPGPPPIFADAPRAFGGTQRALALAASLARRTTVAHSRSVHPEARRHRGPVFSFGYAFHRKDAHFFTCVVSQRTTISFHEP